MLSLGVVAGQQSQAAVESSLDTLQDALRPYRVGEYASFVDDPADASRFFDADTWRRLREVKALYDPTEMFRANHEIPAAQDDVDASLAA